MDNQNNHCFENGDDTPKLINLSINVDTICSALRIIYPSQNLPQPYLNLSQYHEVISSVIVELEDVVQAKARGVGTKG